MVIGAAEFKAKCLALLDRVRDDGEVVTITKHGRVVARLVPVVEADERPWHQLKGQAQWKGDPLAPAVRETEVEALR